MRRSVVATRCAVIVLGIAALELAARAKLAGPTLSVPPSIVVPHLFAQLGSGALAPHLARSASEIALGFALGALVGIPTGVVLWRVRWLAGVIEPLVAAYYAVPIFALYPVLIVLLGAGILPIVAIGAFAACGAIVLNTLVGLREIPRVYLAVGRTVGASRAQVVRHVVFPAAVPQLFVGLKLGFIYALIAVIAAEFILATVGLGYEVSFHYNNFESRDMFATMLLVIALSVGVNALLTAIENRLRHRRA